MKMIQLEMLVGVCCGFIVVEFDVDEDVMIEFSELLASDIFTSSILPPLTTAESLFDPLLLLPFDVLLLPLDDTMIDPPFVVVEFVTDNDDEMVVVLVMGVLRLPVLLVAVGFEAVKSSSVSIFPVSAVSRP